MIEQLKSRDNSQNFPQMDFFDANIKKEIEKLFQIRISNIAIFEQAFTHRSYLSVIKDKGKFFSNERLEFLGDSVLGLIISDYLFNFFPNQPEGELTTIRSRIVNKHSLAMAADRLNIKKYIKFSFSAEKLFEKNSESILADTLEAIIAAIYVDAGIEKTVAFIYNHLLPMFSSDILLSDSNYKSQLLEILQSNCKKAPTYQVLFESGPDHDKSYSVGAFVGDILIGTGEGKRKKDAEQAAAHDAIKNLNL